MKRTAVLFAALIGLVSLTACTANRTDSVEKLHDDVAAEGIQNVTISGSARSIVIRPGEEDRFVFHNGDLNSEHRYEVRCDEVGDTLAIDIMMETEEEDNDILGSVLIDVPQKEFEKIEVAGEFNQVSLSTMNADVVLHGDQTFVNLDVEAGRLNHDITLDASEGNTLSGVSLYFDQFPADVKMELNLTPDGSVNDPGDILKQNGLEAGSGKPVISISDTKIVNLYNKE